jgi:hypothetical protein
LPLKPLDILTKKDSMRANAHGIEMAAPLVVPDAIARHA